MAGRTYKTAQGVSINVDQLRLLNERVVAVGNAGVNARGDQVNSDGSIKENRNDIMKKVYRTNATVAGKMTGPNQTTSNVDITAPTVPTPKPRRSDAQASEPTQTPIQDPPSMRGSLAQSISTTVPKPSVEASNTGLLSTSTNTRTLKRI